ncbi:dTDP-glucose 4,6-dehydratase [Microbulbifer thermotolerans]|uniref:dTDP-glucose 4,6-dehydratase n=1 Tax=Microbulbifer thermotolerans TaxID=252514 RepID=UPI00224A7A93|nr:dTDP-glucose 4,6-dehydratase [Microbulbifer thermotolerans]MCX2842538.1 dTDP-glucose 4,6-dehydratase [Microbulbifer thermotolerans]
MSSLLVTGGAGFIGANFVHYWMENYPEDKIVVLDALTYAGNKANLEPVAKHPNFYFCHGNICDTELVETLLKEHRIDTLVHFAAESHVDRSITGPDAFIETNIIGTHSLLKAAKKIWLDEGLNKENHRFHHVSTDEVYGTLGPNDPAFSETTPYAPNSPYSASKAASDHLVRAYHHTYGLQTTISNCSNNYGPYHFPEKLIPLVITNILQDKPLPIYGDGKQIRDWLYVEDHARGIDLVLKKGRVGECYNIGGINEWANIDIVKLICKLMNEEFAKNPSLAEKYPNATKAQQGQAEELITFVTDRAGHDRRYAIDPRKSNGELTYQPQESFATGIQKTINWYIDNETWWLAVIDKDYHDLMKKKYIQEVL